MTIDEAIKILEDPYNDKKYVGLIEQILDHSRWSVRYSQIFHNIEDDTYWRVFWDRGATEYQDEGNTNVYVEHVRPVEKLVTVYEKVR